jgi:ketosteroid isomerase-like protein
MVAECRGKEPCLNDGGDLEMVSVDDLDQVIERSHLALGEIVNGNPEPLKEMYSHRQDVSLANPFGPPVRGWDEAARTMERAASNYRDGEIIGFENVAKFVTSELACIVEVERYRTKVGGSEDVTRVTLRVTSILRPEDGTWKIVHRHADPITTPQPAESVIQE